MMFYSEAHAIKSIAAFASCALLIACGGAGDGGGGSAENQVQDVVLPPSQPAVRFLSTSLGETTPLGFVAINVSNDTSSGFGGNLNQNSGAIGDGLLAGTMDGDRTQISISGGGTATLTALSGTTYSRAFSTSGLSENLFGIVGQTTIPSDMPDMGSSTYSGHVSLQADNGDATFALTGTATVTVGWSATNNVASVFSHLGGRKNDIENVTNVGTVTINNATLSGSTFSGGTLSTSGSDLAYTGGGQRVNKGQFFGPYAAEVGGVFGLTSSALELSGVFSATR